MTNKISAGILIALVATIMTLSWIGATRFDEVMGGLETSK